MKRLTKWLIPVLVLPALVLAAACGGDDDDAPADSTRPAGGRVNLINVSYDPTRELYAEYNQLFAIYYKEKTGTTVTVQQSHGGSGSQARAIVDGLQADVATLALAGDTARLVDAGLIEPGWEDEFDHNSNPYTSTIVLLVRKGNPKNIQDWEDLGKPGVSVITPNPKSSGGARWNFLAAWGSVTVNGGTEAEAQDLVARIYANVEVLDAAARGSTQTFVNNGIGDVLIAWENEALLTINSKEGAEFQIVYPKQSILAEPAVAIVDKNVDAKGTRVVATEYLQYLYSEEAQEVIAKNYYRPSSPAVLEKYKDQYPPFEKEFITIRDFGGWSAVATKFFAEGAIFDQIYKP